MCNDDIKTTKKIVLNIFFEPWPIVYNIKHFNINKHYNKLPIFATIYFTINYHMPLNCNKVHFNFLETPCGQ